MYRKGLVYTMKVDILKSGCLALVARLRLPLDHRVSSTYSLPFCLLKEEASPHRLPENKNKTVRSAARNMNKSKKDKKSCTAKGKFIQ